jgi:hypothetical protein
MLLNGKKFNFKDLDLVKYYNFDIGRVSIQRHLKKLKI